MAMLRASGRLGVTSLALALSTLAGTPGGCAAKSRGTALATEAPSSAIEQLRAISAKEPNSPDRSAMAAPLPPGVAEATVTLRAPADAAEAGRRSIPLDAATDELGARTDLGLTPIAPGPEVDDDIHEEALSHYAAGLEMLLDDEPAQALTELMKATTLDPGAMDPWVLLAKAHARTGHRAAAVAAYKRAIRLGLEDAGALWWLGRDALRDGRTDEAGAWLGKARDALNENVDPALVFLVNADLGEVLAEQGYTLAARDALVEGLDLPAQFGGRTEYHDALAELYRRRAELFLRTGDLSAQLEDYATAAEAYEAASQVPSLDPGAALPRRVFAMMRLGRPATAATLIVDDISREESRLEPRHAELATYLANHTSMGPRLSNAIGEASAEALREATPMQRARLALVRAAASPADGPRVLGEALKIAPQSAEAASALVRLGDEAGTLAGDVGGAVEAAPACADALADAVVGHGRGVDVLIEHLNRDGRAGAKLMAAQLLRITGRPRAALEALEGAAPWPEVLGERAEIAAEAGRVDLAEGVLGELQAGDAASARVPLARARVLRALGRRSEALAALNPLGSIVASTNDLFIAASIAIDAGDARQAEQLLLRARRLDPQDDRIHDSLVAFYAPGGTRPDPTAFGEAARALRQASPTGRMLRLLTARDMVLRGQIQQAEPILQELTRSDPIDPRSLMLLAQAYERVADTDAAQAERGEAYLRGIAERRPEFPAAHIALARVMAARGEAAGGEARLAERYAVWPMESIAAAREQIVREALKQPERAHAMALERLTAAPRTLSNTVALAELHARAGDGAAAAAVLRERWPKGAAPSPEHASRLGSAIGTLPRETKDTGKARGALEFLEACEAIGLPSGPAMLDIRLTLACVALADEPKRLYDIALDTSRRLPTVGDRAFGRVVQALNTSSQPRRVCGFLAELVTRTTPFNRDFALLWVQAVVVNGTVDDAKELVSRLDDRKQVLELVSQGVSHEIDENASLESLRAELSYMLASFLVSSGKEDAGEAIYRTALEFNPKHALAANDLGYQMLEKGADFDECVRLIELAYGQDATRSSITDSMGWVRYKQGQMDDVEEGAGKREGAITLLQRALTLEDGESDASIHDHLGDALWRAGRKDEAAEAWNVAVRLAQEHLGDLRATDPTPTQLKRAEAMLRSPTEKQKAVAAGADPPIAPLAKDEGEATQRRPEAGGDDRSPAKPNPDAKASSSPTPR